MCESTSKNPTVFGGEVESRIGRKLNAEFLTVKLGSLGAIVREQSPAEQEIELSPEKGSTSSSSELLPRFGNC